jgi:hypothetical protein
VNAHLLVDKVRLSEQDIELAGREESTSLRSIVTGDARFNSGGLQYLQRGDYKWCGDTGGGGATFLAASWLPIIAMNLFSVSFMARVASTCFQPLLHLLEPFFVHGRGVNDFR